MSEDDVVLVKVAWQRIEKLSHTEVLVMEAFRELFKKHPGALRVFIQERRRSSARLSTNTLFSGKPPSSRRLVLSELSRRSQQRSPHESKSTQTVISQTPSSRHHLFPPSCVLPQGCGLRGLDSVSEESCLPHEEVGDEVDPTRFRWLPDCMFQMRLDDERLMGDDPEKNFAEHEDIRWLNVHFRRMAMVLHHIVYVLHQPISAQKWLCALRIGHSSIRGIETVYYQDLMVFLERRLADSLGERFYSRATRKAMRKFLTALFGYLAGEDLSLEGSSPRLAVQTPSASETDLLTHSTFIET